MEIIKGQININKTWDFLAPSLRFMEGQFVDLFNNVLKLSVGIYDNSFEADYIHENYFYIMIPSHDPHLPTFLRYVKSKDYYVFHYSKTLSDGYSCTVVVIDFQIEEMKTALQNFILGKYSKMYSIENIRELFNDKKKEKIKSILLKDKSISKSFLQSLNTRFNTDLDNSDLHNFDEYELPIIHSEEVFWSSNNSFITTSEQKYLTQKLIAL